MTSKTAVGSIAFVQTSGMMAGPTRPDAPAALQSFSEAAVAADADVEWLVQEVMNASSRDLEEDAPEPRAPLVQRGEITVLRPDDDLDVGGAITDAIPSWSPFAHETITVVAADGDAWGMVIRI